MTVLDASAVVALLRGEPARAEVQGLLRAGAAHLTATGVTEVVDHMLRQMGLDEESAVADLAALDLLEPPTLDSRVAIGAGRLRARHYHRVRRPVSLADCVAAETARASGPLATSDRALLDLCADEGIGYVALPDSNGVRYAPA